VCKDWDKFNKKCLEFNFYVPELNTPTKRTISIPKAIESRKSKFIRVFGAVLNKNYPDLLLKNPEIFAGILHADLAGNSYDALLKTSPNGRFIDVEKLAQLGDG
jgi:hypothetical protein